MDITLIEKAAKYIYDCRINNRIFHSIPKECIPEKEEDSYLIQKRLHKLLDEKNKDKVIGRKIGCTTTVMQNYLDIKTPCAGRIRSKSCLKSNTEISFENFNRVGVECEVAISLSSDLYCKKNISEECLYNSIDKVIVAIEIVDDRYLNWKTLGAKQLISDDFFGSGCVLGDFVSINDIKNLKKIRGFMYINGKNVGSGMGVDIMGDPILALEWIVGRKDVIGDFLPAGSVVLLGSLVQTKWLNKGDEVKIFIDKIGESRAIFF